MAAHHVRVAGSSQELDAVKERQAFRTDVVPYGALGNLMHEVETSRSLEPAQLESLGLRHHEPHQEREGGGQQAVFQHYDAEAPQELSRLHL